MNFFFFEFFICLWISTFCRSQHCNLEFLCEKNFFSENFKVLKSFKRFQASNQAKFYNLSRLKAQRHQKTLKKFKMMAKSSVNDLKNLFCDWRLSWSEMSKNSQILTAIPNLCFWLNIFLKFIFFYRKSKQEPDSSLDIRKSLNQIGIDSYWTIIYRNQAKIGKKS